MGDQTQAYDIFQTPLSSGYPLPLNRFLWSKSIFKRWVMTFYADHPIFFTVNNKVSLPFQCAEFQLQDLSGTLAKSFRLFIYINFF
jgi:hypothetical protein